MSISKHYEPTAAEDKWYAYWMEKDYFSSTPDEREPFTIVIPPPNVTGVLHMGHMLNNTIQDVLIRKARQEGKNACWVPGTDHASIATEAKVVKMLREQGIKKSDLTRTEFLKHAFEWKDKYGGIILDQLKKLGASCDWKRTAFTMDEERSVWVIKTFVKLYNEGKLYRGNRMVNWDPEAKTVLSNEEVLYNEEQSKLYHVRYQIEGTDQYLTIATTRPETILGDTAIAVNPKDERYVHLQGKKVIVPLVNRIVPIIFDEYVDIEFGTGALKVTPAHDMNDYELGKKHQLQVIEILNEDGSLNENAEIAEFIGLDRFIARKKMPDALEAAGALVGVEDYKNKVGRSERTNAVVEPRLSLQWYVDMPQIASKALDAVMKDDVRFFPENQKNVYHHWMSNIKDWCISRQLWWGHQIPAWYYGEEIFVAESEEEALALAQAKHNKALTINDLRRDEDALDTWFSSWLWPISLFTDKELDYYYPTSVLVTGWDIIFLWVARMVMAGYEWKDEKPFKDVYFTGMVRDKKRRKMSKSLGNSPDALELIKTYGADGVRFGMLSCSPAGGDLLFDEKLCEQGRNFANKLWNALRLVRGWEVVETSTPLENQYAIEWFKQRSNEVTELIQQHFVTYRLSDALMTLYSFVWDDFCSWYLELIKPNFGSPIDRRTLEATTTYFEDICKLLHPFMPFLTEEIWHEIAERAPGNDCIVSKYPTDTTYATATLSQMESLKDIVTKVRDVRQKNSLSPKESLDLYFDSTEKSAILISDLSFVAALSKLANLTKVVTKSEDLNNATVFNTGTDKCYIPLNINLDVEAEKARLLKELEYAKGFIVSVENKLKNEKFVNSAPEIVLQKERQKMADGLAKLQNIQESLAALS